MGFIWEGLGGVWGGIWSLLGPLGSFLGLFFPCLYLEWLLKVLLEAIGLDFGSILEGLGLHLGGLGRGLGRDLESLGASWVAFGALFSKLVFGMVVKGAFGGYWARFWVDFRGFGKDFSCFLLLALAFSCLLLLSLAFSCFLLLSLAFCCLLLLPLDFSR